MKRFYLIIALSVSMIACKEKSRKLPYYNTSDYTPVWEIPDNPNDFHKIRAFSLIDQEGKDFTEKNIENKICVVDFFFTSCPGICLEMTNSMYELQQQLVENKNVLLLSHSVTPEQDSVPVLAQYAINNKVDYNIWKLLTGSKNEIYNLGRKFYFVEEDLGEDRDSSIFLHTENFVLIDKNRIIRGIYNGLDKTSMEMLVADIQVLELE